MRPVVIGIAILAFGALLIGGLTITGGSPFETAVQVRDAEGSAVAATDSQLSLLAGVVIMVVLGVTGTGILIAGMFWLLSREATKAAAAPANPFEFSLSPEGNTVVSFARQNAVPVLITLSIGLVVAFAVLAIVTGAF